MTRSNVELVPVEPKKRARVTLTSGEAAIITAWRLAVRGNGYTPIRTRDKRTLLKGWNALDPDANEIAGWLPPRATRTFHPATGLLVVGKLATIDADLPDAEIAAEARAVMARVAPHLFNGAVRAGASQQRALERGRDDGSPKFMLFTRRAADVKPFTIKSRKWSLTPDVEGAPTFQIEIFASDRNKDGLARTQVGAFGPHTVDDETGEIRIRYQWRGPSPAEVRLSALPELTDAQALAICEEVDRIIERRGYAHVSEYKHGRIEPEDAYDLDENSRFTGEDFDEIPLQDLEELYWQCKAMGEDLRCSGSFLGKGWKRMDRCHVGWAGPENGGHITVHDYATDITHRPADRKPIEGLLIADILKLIGTQREVAQ